MSARPSAAAKRRVSIFNSIHPAPYSFKRALGSREVSLLRHDFYEDVVRCIQANPRLSWSDNIGIVQSVHPIYEMFGKRMVTRAITPKDMTALKLSRSDAASAKIRSRRIKCFVPYSSGASRPARFHAAKNNIMLVGSMIGVMDASQMSRPDWGAFLVSRLAALKSESKKWDAATMACVTSGVHTKEANFLRAWSSSITNQSQVDTAYLNALLF